MASRTRGARTRPVRLTLASLLIIPIVSLVALWGFAASVTLGDTIAKSDYDTRTSRTDGPGRTLLTQLAQERLQSSAWLAAGRRSPHVPLELQREQTDAATAAFRKEAAAAEGVLSPVAKRGLAVLLGRLGLLGGIRNGIDLGAMKPSAAFDSYNGILDAGFQFLYSAAATSDVSIYQGATANIDASRALDMVGRESTLVTKSFAAGRHMSAADHNLFVSALASQRLLETRVLAEPDESFAAPYRQLFTSSTYTTFGSMEDSIAATGRGKIRLRVDPAAWQSQTQAFLTAFDHAVRLARQEVSQNAGRSGGEIRLRFALAGGLGLIAVAASIFLLLRFSRRIAGQLGSLHAAARDLADERLPLVVGRLGRGEAVDVDATALPRPAGAVTEVANVAQALSAAARTAIDAAVGQARLRKSANQVCLSLARRNQALLHKQLDMLDAMERNAPDPPTLENLLLLDHLTTRMRRHAESLIILSGEVPARGWRGPALVVDVICAAVAEVLDYTRVDVVTDSLDAIAGAAVADIVHLLAELIENATAFSPPNTRVTVSADRVANGFVVEIEDRGLGIEAAELAEINTRLAGPPLFEFADSGRIGLLVVGHLAARYGIKVAFRESPFGGTSVIVLMPHSMVVPERDLPITVGSAGASARRASSGSPSGTSMPRKLAVGSAGSAWSPASRRAARRDAGDEGAGPIARGRASLGAAAPETPGPAGDGAPGGLPRRIRQANLVPQLRTDRLVTPDAAADAVISATAAEAEAIAAGSPTTNTPGQAGSAHLRSPDEARALLASLQRGWERGRNVGSPSDDGRDAGPTGPEPVATAKPGPDGPAGPPGPDDPAAETGPGGPAAEPSPDTTAAETGADAAGGDA